MLRRTKAICATIFRYWNSALRLCGSGDVLGQFLGLLAQGLDLGLYVVGVQFEHVLGVPGLQKLLGEFQRCRHVALGERDDLALDFARAGLRRGGMPFERRNRPLGCGHQFAKRLLSLLNALLGERPHFWGDEVGELWVGHFSLFPTSWDVNHATPALLVKVRGIRTVRKAQPAWTFPAAASMTISFKSPSQSSGIVGRAWMS